MQETACTFRISNSISWSKGRPWNLILLFQSLHCALPANASNSVGVNHCWLVRTDAFAPVAYKNIKLLFRSYSTSSTHSNGCLCSFLSGAIRHRTVVSSKKIKLHKRPSEKIVRCKLLSLHMCIYHIHAQMPMALAALRGKIPLPCISVIKFLHFILSFG